jgi:hypothetical protein
MLIMQICIESNDLTSVGILKLGRYAARAALKTDKYGKTTNIYRTDTQQRGTGTGTNRSERCGYTEKQNYTKCLERYPMAVRAGVGTWFHETCS